MLSSVCLAASNLSALDEIDLIRAELNCTKDKTSKSYINNKQKLEKIILKNNISYTNSDRFVDIQRLMREKKYNAAVYELNDLVEKGVEVSVCYEMLGDIAREIAPDPKTALQYYQLSLKENPKNHNSKYKIATLYFVNSRNILGIETFSELVNETNDKEILNMVETFAKNKVFPKDNFEANNLYEIVGRIYLKTGRVEESYLAFLKAIQLNPYDIYLKYYLGELFYKNNKLVDAVNVFNSILREFPTDNQIRTLKAKALAKDGKTQSAINEYLIILEDNPDSKQARIGIYELYKKSLFEGKILPEAVLAKTSTNPNFKVDKNDLLAFAKVLKTAGDTKGAAIFEKRAGDYSFKDNLNTVALKSKMDSKSSGLIPATNIIASQTASAPAKLVTSNSQPKVPQPQAVSNSQPKIVSQPQAVTSQPKVEQKSLPKAVSASQPKVATKTLPKAEKNDSLLDFNEANDPFNSFEEAKEQEPKEVTKKEIKKEIKKEPQKETRKEVTQEAKQVQTQKQTPAQSEAQRQPQKQTQTQNQDNIRHEVKLQPKQKLPSAQKTETKQPVKTQVKPENKPIKQQAPAQNIKEVKPQAEVKKLEPNVDTKAETKDITKTPTKTTAKKQSKDEFSELEIEQERKKAIEKNKNDYAKYKRVIDGYEAITPKTSQIYLAIANTYKQMGMPKSALQNYKEALKLEPANSNINYDLGLAYLELNSLKTAKNYLAKSISLDKENTKAVNLLAFVNQKIITDTINKAYSDFEKKEYLTALDILGDGLKEFPKNAQMHYYRALVYDAMNRNGAQVIDLQKAIEFDPAFYMSYYQLGVAYEKIGDLRSALVAYERFLSIEPDEKELIDEVQKKVIKLGKVFY